MKRYVLVAVLIIATFDFFSDRFNIIFYPKNREYHTQNFIKIKDDLKAEMKTIKEIEVNDELSITDCKSLDNANLSLDVIIKNKQLYDFYKKCTLLNILKDSTVVFNKKMTKNVHLTDFTEWSSQLVLTETCSDDMYAIHELQNKYDTVQDLIDENIVKTKVKDKNYVIFEDLYDGKKLYVKELTRCAFKNDDYQYLILEIKISDLKTNNEECTIYRKYSKYSDVEGVLNRKF